MAESLKIESFWKALPSGMKDGNKIAANTRFIRICNAGQLESLQKALQAYRADQAANPWRRWQYCPTWLGSANHEPWRKWADEAEAEPESEAALPLIQESELRMKAEAIMRSREQERGRWYRASESHMHSSNCNYGKVCVYMPHKVPKVPTLEEAMEYVRDPEKQFQEMLKVVASSKSMDSNSTKETK